MDYIYVTFSDYVDVGPIHRLHWIDHETSVSYYSIMGT